MPHPNYNPAPVARHGGQFATTRWSVVVAAGQSPSADAHQSLAALCEAYWYPLYAFVRRSGYSVEDAQDLTQAFFVELLEKGRLRAADPRRGKFRTFLLAAMKNFLANQWRAASAQKRGGAKGPLSLDFDDVERRYSREPGHNLTAEKIYDRRWAMALLEGVLGTLAREQAAAGKGDLFEGLKGFLGGDKNRVPYREIADRLAVTEGAVKVAVHRLRRRYRELLRSAIANTVSSPDEVEDELRALFAVVGR